MGAEVIFKDLRCSLAATSTTAHQRQQLNGPEQQKVILGGITGVFPRGQLTVVMGASGAGKTTLLQIISGRVPPKSSSDKLNWQGEIYVNARKVESADYLRRISAFVHQIDCIDPWMTVEEALRFSARLRLRENSNEIEDKVNHVMELLELNQVKDSYIGTPSGSSGKRGISGGERKRVAIGMELMSNPLVLFLDEPTTGLDTFMAFRVIETMYNLARAEDYAIIMILHQPPSCVFPFFDNLLLLTTTETDGAGIIYHGNAVESLGYFAQLGYHCGRLENPSDFYFSKVINAEKTAVNLEALKGSLSLVEAWKTSQENEIISNQIQASLAENNDEEVADDRRRARRITAAFVQYWLLLVRMQRSFWRSREDLITFVIIYPIFEGVLVGLTYLNLARYAAAIQVDLRAAAIFFLLGCQFGSGKGHWIGTAVDQQKIFNREYGNGYYGYPPHFLSTLTFEMLLGVLTSVLIVTIPYYMIGLAPAFSSLLFLIFLCLMAYFGGCGFGYMILGIMPENKALATMIKRSSSKPLTIAGGLFAVSIPAFMIWIRYISPIYYSFSAALQNQLDSLPCRDNGDGTCRRLKEQDIFSVLEFDASLSPGVCFALGMTVAIAFLTIGITLQQIHKHK